MSVCLPVMAGLAYALESSEKLIFEKNSLYQYISVTADTVKKGRYVPNQKRDFSQGGMCLNAPDTRLSNGLKTHQGLAGGVLKL